MKKIQIGLFATLRPFLPKNSESYPIEAGTTVRDLLESIGVPLDTAKLIFIDGKKGELDRVLNGGERVGVFPPVGGG